ncbi:T9SS type A sorting domain-containing protein [Mariniphaga sediminis]|uniref:T9SS type A sorting domain-containing protein n=1 Tax=Mariniphaga sediminis TaxID=1628158 RepID=UPI0035627E39
MKHLYKITFIVVSMLFVINVFGQRYVLIDSDNANPTDIYPEIMGDTNTDGSRVDNNTIYQLKNGMVYLCGGTLINAPEWALQIEAENLNNTETKPLITRKPNDAGSYSQMFNTYGDFSLTNLWVILGDQGAGIDLSWGSIRFFGENSTIKMTNCIMEKDRGAVVQCRAAGMKIYVTGCHIRNGVQIGPFTGNGRFVDTRNFHVDSLVVKRCYIYDMTDRIFRSMGSSQPHNYVEFDHNTIFRQSGHHGCFQFETVKTLKITNNLLVNPLANGTTPANTTEQTQPDNEAHKVFTIDSIIDGIDYTFEANNIFWDQGLLDYYASNDTVSPVNVYSDLLVEVLGGETAADETYISERVVLTNTPTQDIAFLIKGYYENVGATPEEMLAIPITLQVEDIGYAGTPYDYGFLFDYSEFDGGYTPGSESATGATDGSAIGVWAGPTGIFDNQTQRSSLSLFPNPASNGFVTIELEEEAAAIVYVYDVTGKQVMQASVEGKLVKLNVSDLTKGVYIVNVNNAVQKLIIK